MSSIGGYLQRRKSTRKLAKVRAAVDTTALSEAWDNMTSRTTSTWSATTSTSKQTELEATEQSHQKQVSSVQKLRSSHLTVPKLRLHNPHPPHPHTPESHPIALGSPVAHQAQRSTDPRPPPTRRETTSKSMASLRRAIAQPFRHTESSSGSTPPTEYFFKEEPSQPSRLGQVNSHTSYVINPFSFRHGPAEQGEVVARAGQDEGSNDGRQACAISRENIPLSRKDTENIPGSRRRSSGGVFFATKTRDAPNNRDEPVKTVRVSRSRSLVKKPEYLDLPVPRVSLSFLEEMQMDGLCLEVSSDKL